MRLCVCIMHNRDRNRLSDELVSAGFKFTVIGSTGGFLREGNTTMLIVVEESDMEGLFSLIRSHCKSREQIVNVAPMEPSPAGAFMVSPVKVPVGGAVVFVMPVERFERF